MFENVTLAAALTAILQGIGVGGGLYMVRWLMLFFAGRKDHREARNDAETQRLMAGMRAQIDALTTREAAREARLEHVETELAESRDQHAECREELSKLRGLIQGRGDARNEAAAIVARDRVADKRKPRDKE